MTEAEWLTSTDSAAMLRSLQGSVSSRKLRLFTVAVCRLDWHLLLDKPYHGTVDVAERFGDGLADDAELAAACAAAERVAWHGSEGAHCVGPLWEAGWYSDADAGARAAAGMPDAPAVLALAAALPDPRAGAELCVPWATALGLEPARVADLLRDVIHAPHRSVHWRAAWRAWGRGTTYQVAETIYHERAFDRLPVLADALEEAGCDAAEVVDHCREHSRIHARGCWVVDVIIGKW